MNHDSPRILGRGIHSHVGGLGLGAEVDNIRAIFVRKNPLSSAQRAAAVELGHFTQMVADEIPERAYLIGDDVLAENRTRLKMERLGGRNLHGTGEARREWTARGQSLGRLENCEPFSSSTLLETYAPGFFPLL
ncbi:MAG: hypothetical protein KF799_05455 [Bdellovibrionales bacterium]|nr:hypothetical protein [Bdellovibrionales bacterium]